MGQVVRYLGAMLLIAASTYSQEAAPTSQPTDEESLRQEVAYVAETADEPELPQFSFLLSANYTTGYWGRGVFIENQDVIVQPTLAMDVKVYEDPDAFINSFSFTFESFNSLNVGPSGMAGDHSHPELWNESDANLGFAFGFWENFSFGAYYSWIISPNNSYDTIEEVDMYLSYDDAGLWESWGVEDFAGLQPSLTLAVEHKNQADGGLDEGVYLEIALAPSLPLYSNEDGFYVNLTVPLTVGLSLSQYYEDPDGSSDTFGFFDFGLDLALPLTFVPSCLGTWEMVVGVHGLWLGEAAEHLNEDPGEDFIVIGTVGISVSF